MLRAKFRVFEVSHLKAANGETIAERVKLHAVYGDTPENKVWAKSTPTGALEMQIDNPGAFGTLRMGDEVFLDFHIQAREPVGPTALHG